MYQIKNDTILKETLNNSDSIFNSIWFWISIIELIIIIYLLIKISKKKDNLAFSDISKEKLKEAQKTNVDMENLMNSINGSKELYKELSRLCHPDKFVNTDKQLIADKIFQEISKNKRNYNKLIELKQTAINDLNIKF
jgi:hypothetical protein